MQRPNRMANENRSLMDLHDTMPCPPANYVVIIQRGILLILNFSKGEKKKKTLANQFSAFGKKKKNRKDISFQRKEKQGAQIIKETSKIHKGEIPYNATSKVGKRFNPLKIFHAQNRTLRTTG